MLKRYLQISNNMIRLSYSDNGPFEDISDFVNPEMMKGNEITHSPSLIRNVTFYKREIKKGVIDGEPIIKTVKTVDGQRTSIENLEFRYSHDAYRACIEFNMEKDEHIYGFGQDENGVLNKRKHISYLYQHNMIIPIPFFVSSKGYGVLIDSSCLMKFDGTKEIVNLTLECVNQVDLYVITGTVDEIIAGYRSLTGKATRLPDWAFGYMQSKESYINQQELLDVVNTHRTHKVPLDVIIQDWETWEGDKWGEKLVDKERYPDLRKLKEKLHESHVHALISVWPNMNVGGENHTEFANSKQLLNDYSTYNAFDPEARKKYYEQCNKELSKGFDGWWCDNTEPFPIADWNFPQKKEDHIRYKLVGNTHEEYLGPEKANAFALYHAKGFAENQLNSPVVNLSRAGYAGIQKYGVILWAGDTSATWSELKKEVAKGMNVSLSGIPYWTVDSGGFFAGGEKACLKWHGGINKQPLWCWGGDYDQGIENLGYQELYTRWLQFSTFLPVMRSHGTDTPREFFHFHDEFKTAIINTIKLRYLLSPYILNMVDRVHAEDYTIMRSLIFDFSHDKNIFDINDQFMFGDDILVCPILEPMYYDVEGNCIASKKIRNIYLPIGCNWINFYTRKEYEGGNYIDLMCDIEKIPLFVKKGSKIPIKRELQYINEDKKLEYLEY